MHFVFSRYSTEYFYNRSSRRTACFVLSLLRPVSCGPLDPLTHRVISSAGLIFFQLRLLRSTPRLTSSALPQGRRRSVWLCGKPREFLLLMPRLECLISSSEGGWRELSDLTLMCIGEWREGRRRGITDWNTMWRWVRYTNFSIEQISIYPRLALLPFLKPFQCLEFNSMPHFELNFDKTCGPTISYFSEFI